MRASAFLAVARAQTGDVDRTRITRLHSEPPLILRPTIPAGPAPLRRWRLGLVEAARVALSAGAAGPLGGDDLRLDVEVGPGAVLVLRSVAASLVLPGPHGAPSRSDVRVYVAAGGALVWLPGLVIAAHGCRHHAFAHVTLEAGARLLVREEFLLGRHAEAPGALRQRLRVCLGDRPLYDQELAVGPGADGWDGPAVTGGSRAVGAALVVDPAWGVGAASVLPPTAEAGMALLPLSGPAVVVSALADDAVALRGRLEAGLAVVEAALPL